ncbi:MAG TPA: adenylate cyclase [Ruminiclostridium sp.]|nr:adenylate cyclase [Ruminiclostridium sp.]
MALEIERKFLIKDDGYKKNSSKILYRQGYLESGGACVVRVRIAGEKAFLTVKGTSKGAVRQEFEYPIPFSDGQEMLKLCEKPLIEKIRYTVFHGGMTWEIDEFLGENEGLVLAEIELLSPDQAFPKPGWLGEEVTGDPRYYNSNLIHEPFKSWPDSKEQSP